MILAYHRVNPWYKEALTVSPENFEKQVRYLLEKGLKPVSIYQYIEELNKRNKNFCITFDDGFADNFLFAFPIFKKYKLRPIIFLTAHFIGTEKLPEKYKNREKDRYLKWKEVHEMLHSHVDFGSHTLTHPDLTTLDRKHAWDEILESKKFIQKNIGKKIDFFCYPYGKQNEKIREMVKNAGYHGAVITNWKGKIDLYSLPRIGIYGHNSFFIFKLKLCRARIFGK